uniref:Hyaluronidase n=1 Tax=Culicoides nubeculosus TaxID=144565 RepID=D9IL12_CULNU|nr:Cul n 2 allergen [Culicoides nubeculosus]
MWLNVVNVSQFMTAWATFNLINAQQLIQVEPENVPYEIVDAKDDASESRGIFFNNFITSKNNDNKRHDFTFYWNIPSFMCSKYNVTFTDMTSSYNIVQNKDDKWRGDQIIILYDPGKFPALLEHQGKLYRRNGGVPQGGNLQEHIDYFAESVNTLIPDQNFSGIGVIDFESWRPIYRQNSGVLQPYKDLSYKLVQRKHRLWSKKLIEEEAAREFETAGRSFVEETVKVAKYLRPNAKWGYYGFPYCFNMNGGANMKEDCPSNVKEENNRIKGLWDIVDVVLPSVYLNNKITASQRVQFVRGRMREGYRVSQLSKQPVKPPVYSYLRYVYTDNLKYISNDDLKQSIKVSKEQKGSGLIFWGSSYDVKTKDQCFDFRNYVDNNLGPIVLSANDNTPKILTPNLS